jgi:hypothetical protein
MARYRKNRATQEDLCGTNDGWKRHRQCHTPVCTRCYAAREAFAAEAQDRRIGLRTDRARFQIKDSDLMPGVAELAAHLVMAGWANQRAYAHACTVYTVMAPHIRAALEQEGEGNGYRLHSA